MATRKIISIDNDLCNGCGNCVTGCAEGALQIVDGKAKLVKQQFCDGFGDCIGTCPTGALKIEERESEEFDREATRAYLRETQGEQAVERMDEANKRHEKKLHAGGCPGAMMRNDLGKSRNEEPVSASGIPAKINTSALSQWPVQLHLVQPGAPFFKDRELVVLSTCAPIASADVHWRFIRGRAVVVACPKLDKTEGYDEKLARIFTEAATPNVTVVRMEVPCCGGLTGIVRKAVELSGREDLTVHEVTVGLGGEVIKETKDDGRL